MKHVCVTAANAHNQLRALRSHRKLAMSTMRQTHSLSEPTASEASFWLVRSMPQARATPHYGLHDIVVTLLVSKFSSPLNATHDLNMPAAKLQSQTIETTRVLRGLHFVRLQACNCRWRMQSDAASCRRAQLIVLTGHACHSAGVPVQRLIEHGAAVKHGCASTFQQAVLKLDGDAVQTAAERTCC